MIRSSAWLGTALALVAVAAMIAWSLNNLALQRSTAAPAGSALDLQTDTNGDHLPDELVAELQRLGDRFDQDLDASRDKEAFAAVTALFHRLPLAESTYAAHAQVKQLLAQQAATSDPVQKMALAQQIDTLLQGAETLDPAYQSALATVKQLAGVYSGAAAASQAEAAAPDFSKLQRGDILLIRGGNIYLNWIYAQHYSHAGIYAGDGLVLESNPDGVHLKSLSKWQEPGHLVALARSNRLSSAEVNAALDWALQSYKTDGSTHYNHDIVDKWLQDKVYCSQLVWKVTEHAGVDLDSNDFWYIAWITTRLGPLGPELAIPAVLPDEVALSDAITIYSSGMTR